MIMRKVIGLIGLLLPLMAFGQRACPDLSYENSHLKQIQEKGVITIATFGNNPPFFWRSHGLTYGYDHEVMKSLAHQLGVKLKIVEVASNQDKPSVIDLVESGQVDMSMANLVINPIDAKRVAFSSPYIEEEAVLIVNRKKLHQNGWGMSIGYYKKKPHRIAVVGTGIVKKWAHGVYPKSTPVFYPSMARALEGVAKGEADMVLTQYQRVLYLLAHKPGLVSHVVVIKGQQKELVGFAIPYASLRLRQWLEFFIMTGRASKIGFVNQAYQKYFATGVQNESI